MLNVRLILKIALCALISSTNMAAGTNNGETVLLENTIAKNPVARFDLTNGTPALVVDGQRLPTMNYWMIFNHLKNDEAAQLQLIQNSRDNGVHFYWISTSKIKPTGRGEYDFSAVDEKCEFLLSEDPDAYIGLFVELDNHCNPELKSWVDSHPDEQLRDSHGSNDILYPGGAHRQFPSMSSKLWQDLAEDILRKTIRHVRAAPYGHRVIGYQPTAGISWEWMHFGSYVGPQPPEDLIDYSEPARQGFIDWLKTNYANIKALNSRWGTTYTSFDQIILPPKEDRLRSDLFSFLDAEKSQKEIDLRRYHAEVVADVIIRYARAVKEETNGESLCGCFYGYVMQLMAPVIGQLSGHRALHKVLQSPYVDYLISPSLYQDRAIGGGSGFMSTTDSVRLHGKLWIDQADLRTHNADVTPRTENADESKAVMLRHFGHALASGCSEQWYDFSKGWIAGDVELMRLAGKLRQIEERLMDIPRTAHDSRGSIAVITDEKSADYTAMTSRIHFDTVVKQYQALSRTGAGFDTYLLDDLQSLPDYKCYLFLNTFRITKSQQEFIDKNLKRDGKTLIFVCAPGITDENKLLPERVSEITGIKMDVMDHQMSPKVVIDKKDHPMLKYANEGMSYIGTGPFGPIFIPREGQILGLLEGESDKPGLVVKQNDIWISVFSTAPVLPAELLRGIAEEAGCTMTNPTDGDITYVGDKMITVHTEKGGRRKLNVEPKEGEAEDLLTGEQYTVTNGTFNVELQPRSTTLFLVQ